MGEGGGFPQVRALVSLMNLGLTCSSIKNVIESLMQVQVSN